MARIQGQFASGARIYRQANERNPHVCAYRVYHSNGDVIAEGFSRNHEACERSCRDTVTYGRQIGDTRTYEIVPAVLSE